ncbi:MAG: methyltransferase domain-containing protein [Cyanobacteria bacterium CRU_2_1]|nr:methyltransferase domain-containing protein [Cyanobacteria bacterium RU_5_0]NJR57880.1 methyltransferase domain-containing protein [Cyanobacteria bacterium CRU_2_1]
MNTFRVNTPANKQKIAKTFGQAAKVYNAQAQMQKDCAKHVLKLVESYKVDLPDGVILEIGCGTGFVTKGLIQLFPDRPLEITDLSSEMLHFCQTNLKISSTQEAMILFRQVDGETIATPSSSYAAIASSFVIQWFQTPIPSLRNLLNQLKPGGYFFLSFPTCHSFPEWKSTCEYLNLPWTVNSLPDPKMLIQQLSNDAKWLYWYEEEICLTFPDATHFFKSLKSIGAGFNQTGKRLTLGQMRQLIQYWDSQIADELIVHCHIFFGVIQR